MRFPISISGLVVEYIVAIDVTRVRFPADAFRSCWCACGMTGAALFHRWWRGQLHEICGDRDGEAGRGSTAHASARASAGVGRRALV